MEERRYNGLSMAGGVLLIIVGLAFFAVTQGAFDLNWGNMWPLFPMAAGASVLVLAFFAPSPGARAGLVIGGTIPFLVGAFFLLTVMDVFSWEAQGQLWPVYPLIVGVALFGAYFASGLSRGYLVPAVILTGVGLVFLSFTLLDPTYNYISKLWPIVLVIVGVALLFPGLNSRRDSDAGQHYSSGH